MSWQDRINNTVFTITTGDGKVFTPLWKNGETSKEFNTTFFDFINLPGTLVDRKQVRSRQFPLIFWFQGDDNIDQAAAFDLSTNDPRAWTVVHPFYGIITGQPVKIGMSDANYGITEVNVDFWETIIFGGPTSVVSIPDATAAQFTQLAVISPNDYAAKVDLAPADVSAAVTIANKIDAFIGKALNTISAANATVSDPVYSDYNDYQLVKNAMFTGLDNLVTAPVPGMGAVFAVISMPAQFSLSVQERLQLFTSVYGGIAAILLTSNPNNKAFFECGGAAVIGAMCAAAVNPQATDYVTRNDIAQVSAIIMATYTDYLQQLDTAYVQITDTANSFSASNQTQTQLQALVISTIANLNTLAFNAKQERLVILDRDSNLIVLTHKYMGLDKLDANLETFRTLNNIKNKELFLVKKGRKIKYLV